MEYSIILVLLVLYIISIIPLFRIIVFDFLTKNKSTSDEWIKYDFMDLEKRPKESGRYFVCRKDGKLHWEIWNGSGFAYNGNSITHFRKINPPNC